MENGNFCNFFVFLTHPSCSWAIPLHPHFSFIFSQKGSLFSFLRNNKTSLINSDSFLGRRNAAEPAQIINWAEEENYPTPRS